MPPFAFALGHRVGGTVRMKDVSSYWVPEPRFPITARVVGYVVGPPSTQRHINRL